MEEIVQKSKLAIKGILDNVYSIKKKDNSSSRMAHVLLPHLKHEKNIDFSFKS